MIIKSRKTYFDFLYKKKNHRMKLRNENLVMRIMIETHKILGNIYCKLFVCANIIIFI